MKKTLSLILILFMLLNALLSCTDKQTVSEDIDSTDETVDVETEDSGNDELKLNKYEITDSSEYFSISSAGIEFCANYDGEINIKMSSSGKSVNYKVFINGKETGTLLATQFKSPKAIPGSAENAGNKVSVKIMKADDSSEIDIKFHEITINGTLDVLESGSMENLRTYNIISNKDKIHIQGRSIDTLYGASFDWSASGIEFNATYTGSVCVSGKGPINGVQFRVYVNGTETGIISFDDKYASKKLPGTYSIKETSAHIRLVRIEYVKDGLTTLKTVELAGEIHEWQEERKFIEFIGDSITCGYGSVTNDASKDASRTFAYLTACEFDVDYSMVAISGIGVSKSTSQHSGKNMNDFYKYNTWYRNSNELYIPENKADLVVVNLNTNDKNNNAVEETYKADLKTLISDIRTIHGEDVNIVWIIGQMVSASDSVNDWLNDVFEELGGETEGLYVVETTKNNVGGDGHPSYDSHKVTSGHLIEFIKNKNLLD